MWYALKRNGEVIEVKRFNERPGILDFEAIIRKDSNYHVVEVQVIESEALIG